MGRKRGKRGEIDEKDDDVHVQNNNESNASHSRLRRSDER